MKKNATIGLRLDEELRASVERVAAEERRPMASMCRIIIENYLRDHPAAPRERQRSAPATEVVS